MIKIITIALLLLTSTSSQHNLTVEIENKEPKKGKIYLAFWDNKKEFLDNEKTKFVKIVDSDDKNIKVELPSIKSGWWAMALLQDENNNKEMDYNFFGVPQESFGFSNNPKIFMAEPSFDECKFLLQKDTTIRVNID